jgi:hypothetical protein
MIDVNIKTNHLTSLYRTNRNEERTALPFVEPTEKKFKSKTTAKQWDAE